MQENILNSIPIENDYYKILPLKLNELSLLAYDVENFEQSVGYKYNYYLKRVKIDGYEKLEDIEELIAEANAIATLLDCTNTEANC